MTADTHKPQLDAFQAGIVERARKGLADARADSDPEHYGIHLGALTSHLALVLAVVDELAPVLAGGGGQ